MRTIIVGDVHGCHLELAALLDRVKFESGDQLVFVGDLVARGPDSLAVLDIARETGAIVVRGNHEQKLIDWRDSRNAWVHGGAEAKPPIGKMHRDVARALRPVDWTILDTSLFWLDLPEHGIRVVHAGVVPGVPLASQRTDTLMRIRTVPGRDRQGKKTPVLWGTKYVGPPHVIFGHNAAPGLQLHAWATGLDTGCVYGGRLTAMVLGMNQKVPRAFVQRQALLVSEPARRVWFDPTTRQRVA